MKAFRWTCACAYLALSSTLLASTVDGITISHFDPLERMSFQRNGTAVLQKLQTTQPGNSAADAGDGDVASRLDQPGPGRS